MKSSQGQSANNVYCAINWTWSKADTTHPYSPMSVDRKGQPYQRQTMGWHNVPDVNWRSWWGLGSDQKSHGYIQWLTGASSLYEFTEKAKCWSQSTQLQCRWTKTIWRSKRQGTYPCISNAVFKIVRRAGVPIKRFMAMRWILTWKETLEGTKTKTRLVAQKIHRPRLTDDQNRNSNAQ